MASQWSGRAVGNESGRAGLLEAGRADEYATRPQWALLWGGGRIEALERYGTVAARILLSQIFLISGIMKIVDWAGTEAQMASRGMFWIPFFHVAAMLTELICGLSLLLGYKARVGALLLFLFLIPVTLTFHNFWT